MTTFQIILLTVIQAACAFLPITADISGHWVTGFLAWSSPGSDFYHLISLISILVLAFFLRFDLLGFLSGLIKMMASPASARSANRSLDQQVVLFVIIAAAPLLIARLILRPLSSNESAAAIPYLSSTELMHLVPWLESMASMILGGIVSFLLLFAGPYLNKRLRGLNHLRLTDAAVIGFLMLLTLHPAISAITVLWFGLAALHYHWEAIFKYSLLILFFQSLASYFMGPSTTILSSLQYFGWMNAFVLCLLAFMTCWITLEQLQTSFSESSYRLFRWIQIITTLGYGVLLFLSLRVGSP
jgi:hypothetical protein